jgi:hypothetical protein
LDDISRRLQNVINTAKEVDLEISGGSEEINESKTIGKIKTALTNLRKDAENITVERYENGKRIYNYFTNNN